MAIAKLINETAAAIARLRKKSTTSLVAINYPPVTG
jgi:hypothetical protein